LLFDLAITVAGIVLLLGGGEGMVRGAASLAQRLGVSPLAVGLTVVAFGTSAPELAVNVTAALAGTPAVAFGNILGSNMANIGLIVALAGAIRPLPITSVIVRREVPMMLLATAVAAAVGLDELLTGAPSVFDRGDGVVLLLLFTVFVYYTVNDVLAQRTARQDAATGLQGGVPGELGLPASLGLTAAGLAALLVGARLTVAGAVDLARDFGVPEEIIGLTLVAVGTSLPEMSASLVATVRGHSDLAIGNVVGSNVFNLLMILGTTAVIRPVPIPERGAHDVVVVGVLSLLLWAATASNGRRIIRAESALLFAVYFGYVAQRSLAATG
jgi:cation:H+ antiporter